MTKVVRRIYGSRCEIKNHSMRCVEKTIKYKIGNIKTGKLRKKLAYNLIRKHMTFASINKTKPSLVIKRHYNTLRGRGKFRTQVRYASGKKVRRQKKTESVNKKLVRISRRLRKINKAIVKLKQFIKNLGKHIKKAGDKVIGMIDYIPEKMCMGTLRFVCSLIPTEEIKKIILSQLKLSRKRLIKQELGKSKKEVAGTIPQPICWRFKEPVCGLCEGKKPQKITHKPVEGIFGDMASSAYHKTVEFLIYNICKTTRPSNLLFVAKSFLQYLLRQKRVLQKSQKVLKKQQKHTMRQRKIDMEAVEKKLKGDLDFLKCIKECLKQSDKRMKKKIKPIHRAPKVKEPECETPEKVKKEVKPVKADPKNVCGCCGKVKKPGCENLGKIEKENKPVSAVAENACGCCGKIKKPGCENLGKNEKDNKPVSAVAKDVCGCCGVIKKPGCENFNK